MSTPILYTFKYTYNLIGDLFGTVNVKKMNPPQSPRNENGTSYT
jgi:hypothetical protein